MLIPDILLISFVHPVGGVPWFFPGSGFGTKLTPLVYFAPEYISSHWTRYSKNKYSHIIFLRTKEQGTKQHKLFLFFLVEIIVKYCSQHPIKVKKNKMLSIRLTSSKLSLALISLLGLFFLWAELRFITDGPSSLAV